MSAERREQIMGALERNGLVLVSHLQHMKPGKPSDEKRLKKIIDSRQTIWHQLQQL